MKEIIGSKIAEAREQRGLKQTDLAEFLGLKSPQAVSEIERGRVNIAAADLYHLADFLNKPISYFFDEDFGGKEIEDVLALVKQLSQEELEGLIKIAQTNTRMKGLLATLPQEGDLDPAEYIDFLEDFYSDMLEIKRPIEAQIMAMDHIIAQFEDLLNRARSEK